MKISISLLVACALAITLVAAPLPGAALGSSLEVSAVEALGPVYAGTTFEALVTVNYQLDYPARIRLEAWDGTDPRSVSDFYCQQNCISWLILDSLQGSGTASAKLRLLAPRPGSGLLLRVNALYEAKNPEREDIKWYYTSGSSPHDQRLQVLDGPARALPRGPGAEYLRITHVEVADEVAPGEAVPVTVELSYALAAETEFLLLAALRSDPVSSAMGYSGPCYDETNERVDPCHELLTSHLERIGGDGRPGRLSVPLLLALPQGQAGNVGFQLREPRGNGFRSQYVLAFGPRTTNARERDVVRESRLIQWRVAGSSWADSPAVTARRGQTVTLRVEPGAKGEVRWYQILPDLEDAVWNNSGDPTKVGRFLYDPITYHRSELRHLRGRREIVAFDEAGGHLLQYSPGRYYRSDLGTFWVQAEVTDRGRVRRSPGIGENPAPRGIDSSVFKVMVRADDSLLGHLTSYYNVPGAYGSTPQQVTEHVAVDCFDALYAAYSLTTGRPYRDGYVNGFVQEKIRKGEIVARVSGREFAEGKVTIRWGRGRGEVRPGDLVAETWPQPVGEKRKPRYLHIKIAYADSNGNGLWDEGDLHLHAGPMPLTETREGPPSYYTHYREQRKYQAEAVILRFDGVDQKLPPPLRELAFSFPRGREPATVVAARSSPPPVTPAVTAKPAGEVSEPRPFGRYPGGLYPDSARRPLTALDLEGRSRADLKIMRNEIFARHGYCFSTLEMRDYFEQQEWYRPLGDCDHALAEVQARASAGLSQTEWDNVGLIREYERGAGGGARSFRPTRESLLYATVDIYGGHYLLSNGRADYSTEDEEWGTHVLFVEEGQWALGDFDGDADADGLLMVSLFGAQEGNSYLLLFRNDGTALRQFKVFAVLPWPAFAPPKIEGGAIVIPLLEGDGKTPSGEEHLRIGPDGEMVCRYRPRQGAEVPVACLNNDYFDAQEVSAW